MLDLYDFQRVNVHWEVIRMLIKNALEEYLNHIEGSGLSEHTVNSYRKILSLLTRHFTKIRNAPIYVDELKPIDIEEYLNYIRIEKHYSTSSLYNTLTAVRCFYDYCVKKEWCSINIGRKIKQVRRKFKERIYLTEDEVTRLLNNIDHPIIQAAAYTLYYAGMRISECIDLKVSDIDFKKGILHVSCGKGAKPRKIPINPILKTKLQNVLAFRNQYSDYVFSTLSGKISKTYINRTLKATASKVGLDENISAHLLRHAFASNLLKNGVDIVRVQRLLGHVYIETTALYLHTNMDGLKDAVNVLGGDNIE